VARRSNLCYGLSIPKLEEKGGALGGTQLILLCCELALIWAIYYAYGLVTSDEMPLWLTTFLVLAVDRLTCALEGAAAEIRTRLAGGKGPS